MNIDAARVHAAALEIVEKQPRVSGSGREAGKVYVTAETDKALRNAMQEAEAMKDEYISVEHLFLGLMSAPDRDTAALLKRFGIEKNAFLSALSTVRGSARVTGDNPEETYDALAKYGSDLTKMAAENKLDPVIGRDR